MMKKYFIATAIFVGLVAFVMAMSYFSGLDYDILFIEFMLTYLVINKLSEIQNDKKEKIICQKYYKKNPLSPVKNTGAIIAVELSTLENDT